MKAKYRKPMDGLGSEALNKKILNLFLVIAVIKKEQFLVRQWQIASLPSLVIGPSCVADSRLVS